MIEVLANRYRGLSPEYVFVHTTYVQATMIYDSLSEFGYLVGWNDVEIDTYAQIIREAYVG